MALTACRACGAAVPARSHACRACGASMTPAFLSAPPPPADGAEPAAAAYQPLPPRPAPPPERPWWRTVGGWAGAAGWVVVLAGCFFIGRAVLVQMEHVERQGTEAAELKQEKEHLRKVYVWVQDTLATSLVAESAGRPVPATSADAKQRWAVGRMLVDRWTWEREVMARHGITQETYRMPPEMDSAEYQANARAYPEVGRYLDARTAAIAELQTGFPAWAEGRIAALARESGIPAGQLRGLLPRGFGSTAADAAEHVAAMREVHRYFVRVDPWVRPAGGDMLNWRRPGDGQRADELAVRVSAAARASERAHRQRLNRERTAFSPLIN